jgi:hypothetical protein
VQPGLSRVGANNDNYSNAYAKREPFVTCMRFNMHRRPEHEHDNFTFGAFLCSLMKSGMRLRVEQRSRLMKSDTISPPPLPSWICRSIRRSRFSRQPGRPADS